MIEPNICEKCQVELNKDNSPYGWGRCRAHYKCDDCGATEHLCHYGAEGLFCDPCRNKRMEKRIAEFKGDTTYQDEVVCPWCGYRHQDSWEMEEGEFQCNECEKKFEIEIQTSRTYSTAKVTRKK